MSFIAVPTVYPVFIKELGGNSLAVGSVHVLWMLGLNIPAAFVAQRLKKKSLFKPQMMLWGFVHRAMLLVSAVTTLLFVGTANPSIAVPLFLLLLFFTAFFGSLAGLPWFQVYTKTVPVRLRGRMMGLRQLIGSTAGAFGGYMVGLIIQIVSFPLNFSLLFFLGFIMTMLSLYFLSKVEESPTVQTENDPIFSTHIIEDARRLLRSNVNYRHFLIADALILMSMSAVSFYSIFALEKFSLPPSYAGTFSVIVMLSGIFANIVFGLSADYYGHKINIITVALCSMMGAAVAIVSPNIFLYGFVFMFIACALQVHAISRMPFLAEISSEQERPLYVGITNSITAPSMLLGVVFGFLVPYVGFEIIFSTAASLAMLAVYILYRFVQDPRATKGGI
jgi:MFS family permease